MDIKKEYERWLANATADADVLAELKTLDDAKIEDAFYRDLAFGTGGLRGVIGVGTNRMNVYTVAKASQGLADYLKKNFETTSVAIGYDSLLKSDVFAKVAAGVFAANGVKVNIWPALMPVPAVSFATRYLHTSAGVMVTASHNPSKYNGYKVYGADGCQITTEVAAEILAEIEKLDIFADVKTSNFEAGMANGNIQYIPDEVYTAFVEQVKSQSVLFGEEVNKDVAIVYSPLNGTGLKPVTRTLKEMGYTTTSPWSKSRSSRTATSRPVRIPTRRSRKPWHWAWSMPRSATRDIKEFGGKKVVKLLDYAPGLDGLPKSDVLKFLLEDNCSIVVRPSGTEPKLKTYISASVENKENAEKIEARIVEDAEKRLAC